jgi:hypothetical protein
VPNRCALKVHSIANVGLFGKPMFEDITDNLLFFLKGYHLTIYDKPPDIGIIESEFPHIGRNIYLVITYYVINL